MNETNAPWLKERKRSRLQELVLYVESRICVVRTSVFFDQNMSASFIFELIRPNFLFPCSVTKCPSNFRYNICPTLAAGLVGASDKPVNTFSRSLSNTVAVIDVALHFAPSISVSDN